MSINYYEECKNDINSCTNEELGKIFKASLNCIGNVGQGIVTKEFVLNIFGILFMAGKDWIRENEN